MDETCCVKMDSVVKVLLTNFLAVMCFMEQFENEKVYNIMIISYLMFGSYVLNLVSIFTNRFEFVIKFFWVSVNVVNLPVLLFKFYNWIIVLQICAIWFIFNILYFIVTLVYFFRRNRVQSGSVSLLQVSEDFTCPICLSGREEVEICVQTPCQHVFHESCLTQWFNHLETCKTCPVCRENIS